jgi:hypothetical protein
MAVKGIVGGFILGAALLGASEVQPLLTVKRIHVDRLTGDQSAVQIRDMIINALQATKLFTITENPDRADASLKGSAEDLLYTDQFQSTEGITARIGGVVPGVTRGSLNASVGDQESIRINERKHEAMAAVRLVSKEGDVIWATTQESPGAKFRSASADVADKVVRQLIVDMDKARQGPRQSKMVP